MVSDHENLPVLMLNYFSPVIGMLLVSVVMVSLFEHTENGLTKGNVMIVGEVVRPGRVPWSEHLRLWDALRLAKGFSPTADRGSISITHSHGGVQRRLWIEQNSELASGDTITVGTLPPTSFRIPIGWVFPMRVNGAPREETVKLSSYYTVEADGNIHVPGLGHPIRAADSTIPDLCKALRHAFMEVGKDFDFQLPEICPIAAGIVNVGGEVAIPRDIPWQPGMSLGEIIAKSGGATTYGKLDKIRLLRGKSERVLDVSDRSPANNIEIEPGDQIIVPGD